VLKFVDIANHFEVQNYGWIQDMSTEKSLQCKVNDITDLNFFCCSHLYKCTKLYGRSLVILKWVPTLTSDLQWKLS